MPKELWVKESNDIMYDEFVVSEVEYGDYSRYIEYSEYEKMKKAFEDALGYLQDNWQYGLALKILEKKHQDAFGALKESK